MRRILTISFLLASLILAAQQTKKIKLVQADIISYDAKLVKAQRLIGKVILEHQGSRMYCDSAYLYEESNRFESFGHVRITDQNKLTITGERLDYDADERMAKIYEDITLRDGDMTLTTDYIEYDLDDRRASYFGRGKIVSSVNRNVLTSEAGHYFAESKIMHFKDDVLLTNPQYTMVTDTLHYHSYNEQAYFLGPTTIFSDNNRIYCENGWYDTVNDRARFGEHAHIWSNEQQLLGDSLYYDRNLGFGEAYGNVAILDTVNRIEITGDFGKHMEKNNMSFVTERALMRQYFDSDTLHLHADTLFMSADTLSMRHIAAYKGVRIYKNDMQGVCDSLIYTEADSLIRLFNEPIIWSDENQITGEHIDIKTTEGKVISLFTENMAFIISAVDGVNYNQIKGRELNGFFKDNELVKVSINGNGESIYFAVEEEVNEVNGVKEVTEGILGVNISTCSDILIRIKDREISQVNFIKEPANAFYPLDKIDPASLTLKGFSWNMDLRPKGAWDMFRND